MAEAKTSKHRNTYGYAAFGAHRVVVNYTGRLILWQFGPTAEVFSDGYNISTRRLDTGSFDEGLSMLFKALVDETLPYPLKSAKHTDD